MACKLTKKGIKPCKGLEETMQLPGGQGTRRQGIELQTLINMKTGKFSRQLAIVRSGKHSKKGIIMNNCPFCGGTLYANA
jgi:hypothetical protein